ncbi:MAG: beta-ketoacyl synthase N-terminal-like domain-containing protein [Desulfuromonadales bacterium]|nr:beta-ketoacyl synthase N-terminal-like domain-containing protein [Desulfuromonadales bacterium]
MRMAISGIGISGGFGCGVAALRQALQCGVVEPRQCSVERNGAIDTFPAYRTSLEGLDEFIPKRALRRIDHFSKMTLHSACLALQDARLSGGDLSRMGVIIATGYGALKTTFDFLDSYLDFGYSCSSPTHFSNSVHNAAAAHVSMQFKATAPSLTVTQFEMSVPSALLTAQLWLAEGRVDQVLFGTIDEYCAVLRYCRRQFFATGEQGPLQPFTFTEQSAVVGEGAAFFVLSRGEEDARYGAIDAVTLGNHAVVPLTLPHDDLLIIGADGHAKCGRWYAQALTGRAVAAYAPLYGSFPAAAGFDLAVAALSQQDGILYASPATAGASDSALQVVAARRPLGKANIVCLKFGPGGDYGLIRLSR